MSWRPRIDEESVFRRWMGIEAARLRQGLVEDRKRLSVLLAEEEPQAVTKGGEPCTGDDEDVLILTPKNLVLPPRSGNYRHQKCVYREKPGQGGIVLLGSLSRLRRRGR
jgi:hypothetical protein